MLVPLISPTRPRPAREITVRELSEGGGVLPSAVENPKGLLSRARDVVLLIHGFNVNLCSAGCGYDLFQTASSIKFRSRSISVYWPGDAVSRWLQPGGRPGLYSKTISVLSYPAQVARAQTTAQRLADLISNSRRGA